MKTKMVVFLMLLCFLKGLGILEAAEISYPQKPIEINVAFAAGAGTDLGARMIAANSREYLGQEVVVLNKPGGSGMVGTTLISKAKPDGYTLGAISDGAMNSLPHLEKVSYKLEDFTFIAQYGILNMGIVVSSETHFNTLKDLIEFARANPNKLTISSTGVYSHPHIALASIARIEGLEIKIVPYSGAAPAVTAMLGGHVMGTVGASSGWENLLKAKKAKLLALMGAQRIDEYPGVPTLQELGYPMEFDAWYIIIGPKGIDKAIVAKLREAFKKAMDSPSFIKMAKELGIWVKTPLFDEELKTRQFQRYNKFAEIYKNLGVGIK